MNSPLEPNPNSNDPNAAWPTGAPEQHGLTKRGLEALHEVATELHSTALLVIHDGVLVSEWYASGYGPDKAQWNVWSVTKSVVSTVFGIAVDKGLLTLDERASKYIPSWVGTDSEAVTIRNLLSNDSGRFWSVESDYGTMFAEPDQTAYAIGLEQAVAPGSHWEYNNAAIQTLSALFQAAIGEDIGAFAQRELFEPLGMNAQLGRDPSGKALVYQGVSSSAHDLARYGCLIAQGGKWKGQQIVSKAWLAAATQPSTTLNSAYGYLWWLNREGHVIAPSFPDRAEHDGRLVPVSNQELIAAIGAFGQLVVIDPVGEYVIVRLQEIIDLHAAIESDPNPVGIAKLNTLMTAFEAAKLDPA